MIRRNNNNSKKPGNGLVFMISVFCCIGLIILVSAFNTARVPFSFVADYVFVPVQNGINAVSTAIIDFSDNFKSKQELLAENEALQEEVDELTTQNSTLVLDTYRLSELEELYELDSLYTDYEKTGAYVISKDSGNWFSTFTINKGSDDGIKVDMNVVSGSGLVGIVTSVGKHYATVRSIIDDTNAVSAMILDTSDNFIVSGSLTMMSSDKVLPFTSLQDTDDEVEAGDAVVTSYISQKYLPGLLVGYISEIGTDSNEITKSGTITPVVDFEHLQEVLVILETKQQAGDDEDET